MKLHTLRTDLTLSYVGVLGLLLSALGFAYYHVFARRSWVERLAERVAHLMTRLL